jgi:general secretion pathway protein G
MDTQVIETNQTPEHDKGFSLIELLIVIVILGILATVTVFAVSGITDRGQDAACDAEMKTVEVAVEAYYAQNNAYAADGAALAAAGFLRSAPANHTVSGATVTASGDCA